MVALRLPVSLVCPRPKIVKMGFVLKSIKLLPAEKQDCADETRLGTCDVSSAYETLISAPADADLTFCGAQYV
jgi:hypothetical protein